MASVANWRNRRRQPISPLEGEMAGRPEGGIAVHSIPRNLSHPRMRLALVEIALDQVHQRLERLARAFARCAKVEHCALWRLGGHYFYDALRVEPGALCRQSHLDPRRKGLG